MRRFFSFLVLVFFAIAGCGHENPPPAWPAVAREEMPSVRVDETSTSDTSGCHAAILVYHHITPHLPGEDGATRAMTVAPAAFARQMQHLHDASYVVVSFAAVVDCLTKGESLPAHAVVITIDDGWESPYVYALPVLDKLGFTATFFVVTNMISEDGKDLLSWKQVLDLDRRGMTIGSHSRSHPNLTVLGDTRLKDELVGSKSALEKRLMHSVRFFAYPYGNVNARVIAATRAAGYDAARGTIDGVEQHATDLFQLKVVYVTDDFAAFARGVAQ